MRVRLLVAALAGFGVAVVPALAANQSVQATSGLTFSPATVTVAPGETVTFANPGGGFHNVHFEDGQFQQPAMPSTMTWSVSRTFSTAGTFRFYCDQHGAPGGMGMSGTVVMAPAGSPSAPPATTQPPGAAPAPPTAPPVSAADTTPPTLSSVGVRGGRGALTLRFVLSEPARVQARIERVLRGRARRLTTLRLTGRVGANRAVLRRAAGRRLRAGRYRVRLVVTDLAGNVTRSRARGVSVRS